MGEPVGRLKLGAEKPGNPTEEMLADGNPPEGKEIELTDGAVADILGKPISGCEKEGISKPDALAVGILLEARDIELTDSAAREMLGRPMPGCDREGMPRPDALAEGTVRVDTETCVTPAEVYCIGISRIGSRPSVMI